MANMNRADMINSLALAMGVNAPGSVINNKKYDTQTGTIYCKDRPVSDVQSRMQYTILKLLRLNMPSQMLQRSEQ